MTTGFEVWPDWEPTASMAFTTSMPLVTEPNTTCLPSSQSVLTVQRKNCEPLVPGPAFAMERMPGPVCLRVKFSVVVQTDKQTNKQIREGRDKA